MEWLTEESEREIIIRDNINNWDWDFFILSNEWEEDKLKEWWVKIDFWNDIDFDNIEWNQDRETTKKEHQVCCPDCWKEFTI